MARGKSYYHTIWRRYEIPFNDICELYAREYNVFSLWSFVLPCLREIIRPVQFIQSPVRPVFLIGCRLLSISNMAYSSKIIYA